MPSQHDSPHLRRKFPRRRAHIATEGEPWNTHPTKRVKVLGGELKNSNQSATVDHGAVLIYNARPDYRIQDATIENLKITDTNAKASRQVGISVGKSGGVKNIALKNFTVTGGPTNLFVSDAPKADYAALNSKPKSSSS